MSEANVRDQIEREAGDASPVWGKDGVPMCSEQCEHHDGKRCRILGQRPDAICAPTVEAMSSMLARALR